MDLAIYTIFDTRGFSACLLASDKFPKTRPGLVPIYSLVCNSDKSQTATSSRPRSGFAQVLRVTRRGTTTADIPFRL